MSDCPNRFQKLFEFKEINRLVLEEWEDETWGEYYENQEAMSTDHPNDRAGQSQG